MTEQFHNSQPAMAMTPPAVAAGGGEPVVFQSSDSRLQGYMGTPPKQTRASGPVFSESQSEAQNIVSAEKVAEKGEKHGVVWRLKNAFTNPENIVSTWMTLGFAQSWVDKTSGAWGVQSPIDKITNSNAVTSVSDKLPSMPGKDKLNEFLFNKNFDKSKLSSEHSTKPNTALEKVMAVGITSGILQNLTFLMTKRGGEIPDGKNAFERFTNSLKNPDKHAVHFSTGTMACIISLISLSRLGIAAEGMKNRPDEMKNNMVTLAAGVSGLISSPLVFSGMFKISKEEAEGKQEPQTEQQRQAMVAEEAEKMLAGKDEKHSLGKELAQSLKPSHLKDMCAYAVKHDKVGLLGRALSVVVEMGFVINGRQELKNDPTNESAYKTVKGGATALALTVVQTHFVYDRLVSSSKDKAAPGKG